MLLLALDTSTTAITVALHDGSSVLAEATTLDARGHAEHLAPGVQRVLADAGATPADVTDVAVGLGPGPFTGLRVGIVTGRTLALAVGARVHGVSSLDALAHAAAGEGVAADGGSLLVATDARRKEVYWAAYDVVATVPGSVARRAAPAVGRAADLPEDVRALPTVGRGPELYPDALPHRSGPLDVSAAALASLVVARLAAGEAVDEHEALYLRRPDAVPSAPSAGASPASPAGARP